MPLSDDIEPTSSSLPGYRGGVGWGFTYLNLTRALVQMYRGQDRDSTLLAVAAPEPGQVAFGASLPIAWSWAGRQPTGVTLLLDGHPIARGLTGTQYDLPLAGIVPGPHTLTVRAEGTTTRFSISATEVDSPSSPRGPVTVTVAFSRD